MPKYLESKHSRAPTDPRVSAAWWNEPDKQRHEAVRALLQAMRLEQKTRDALNCTYYSMYLGRGVASLDGDLYMQRAKNTGLLRLNVARTSSAAANSKVAKDKVRVLYLTEGGNWEQRNRGKRMTKLVNGTFSAANLYREQAMAQLMSCVWDLGATYLYRDGTKVKSESVPGCELRVDAFDARYGKPSLLLRDMVVPRRILITQYPKHEKTITEARRAERGAHQHGGWIADCVEVTHAWHLRSGPDEDDGCYTVCLENGTLHHEQRDADYFPFVFHRWEENLLGFYGHSICAQVLGIQDNVNKTERDIQDHCDLSTGFVALETGSSVSKAAWTNDVWRKVEYSGAAPTMVAPPAFQPEKLQWLQFMLQRAPMEVGLSEMSVTSQKPAGLNSGKALREYNDLESERFQMVQQRYEQSFVDAAAIIADLYEEIYEEHGKFSAIVPGAKTTESIDWDKARLDRETFTCRPVPTSFLPSQPSAKLETIQEMLQGGMLSRDEAMVLLDYPDLEAVTALQNAPRLNIEKHIDRMLDPDDPKPAHPEAFWDLALSIKLAQAAYNDAEESGAPEENLDLLRDFMARCQELLDGQAAAAQPAAAPSMPGPGAPMQPGMPPTPAPPPGAAPPPM